MLWVVSAVLLAATISPWLYRVGDGLAHAAAARDLPAVLEWLGAACGRSRFGRFFSRSLMFSAVVLLPVLFWRIRVIRAGNGATAEPGARVLWRSALTQIGAGCLIAGGTLWAMGMTLEGLGAYGPGKNPPGIGDFLSKVLVFAVIAPVLEEWMFRGVLMGLWLKFAKPLAACVGTSLVFAFVHFLEPPRGWVIANPDSPLAGFELLGQILRHFTDPQFFVTDFATLFVIGMILAQARVRTGALWFSIGLHAGWIVAFKGFNLLYRHVPNHPLHPWGVGDTLRSGIFPLLALALTAGICHFVLRRFEAGRAGV